MERRADSCKSLYSFSKGAERRRKKGVDPRLHPHAPAVCLGEERHPAGQSRGGFFLAPRCTHGSREQAAAVQCIPEGAHLCQYGVQSQPGAIVQQLRCPGAEGVLGGEIQQRPVQIAHPHRPPLPGGQGGVGVPGAHPATGG